MNINYIYLISNLIDTKLEQKINNINLSTNDLIILFNHASPLKIKKIKEHHNKYLCLRANSQNNSIQYWGYENAIENCELYQKLLLINYRLHGISVLSQYFKNYDLIEIDNNPLSAYPIGKYPTSGFIIYHHLSKIFNKDQINLINFYGVINDKNIKITYDNNHDYDYEQQYYILNKINII